MAAGTEIARLITRMVGDSTSYQKMMREAQKEAKRTAQVVETQAKKIERIGKSLQKFGASASRLGRSLSLRLTAPLTIISGLAVRSFAQFDNAMTQSTSIMKVTTAQMAEMRDTALSLSGVVAQAPKELAESYFFLASAGKSAEQAMALLPKVAEFATAGAFNMALATDLLTDAQSALGLAIKDVAKDTENLIRVSDVLVKANTLANASVQQFSIALTSKAGAALKSYNVDVEEGVAVLAALADQGIKAQLAGNALDRVIRLLSKASRDNTKEFKKLGFSVFNVDGSMRNLADIIGNIEDITKSMSVETKSATLEMLGFEARVQGVILPLLGTSDAIRKYEKGLRSAQGITKEVADKQMKSFSNQMKILKNQLTLVGIEIGETLTPVIKMLSRVLKEGVAIWRNFDRVTKTIIVTIGLLTAIIGPLLIAMGSLLSLAGFAAKGYVVLIANTIALKFATIGLKTAFVGLIGLGVGAFFAKLRQESAKANEELERTGRSLANLEEFSRQRIGEIEDPERQAEIAQRTSKRLLKSERVAQDALDAERRRIDPEKQRGKGPSKFFEAVGGDVAARFGFTAIPALEENLKKAKEETRKHTAWMREQNIKAQEFEKTTLEKTLADSIRARIDAATKVFEAERKLAELRVAGPEKEGSLARSARAALGFLGKPGTERSAEEIKHLKQVAQAERDVTRARSEFAGAGRGAKEIKEMQRVVAIRAKLKKASEEHQATMEKARPGIEATFLSWRQATAKWHLDFQVGMRERHKAFKQDQKDMEEGRRIAEQFISPQLKFLTRLKDLQRLLNVGAFGQGPEAQAIFDRAVKSAREEFTSATKETKKKKTPERFGLGRVTGAQFGSLEAQQRIAEFRSLRGAGEKEGVAKTNELLTEIRDQGIDEATADPKLVVTAAGLV